MTFTVWKKSMSLRYLIETLLFFCLMLVFQYEVSAFNKDLHISIDEREHFLQLEHEIVARGGLTYKDSHCTGCIYHSGIDVSHPSTEDGHSSTDGHHLRDLAGGGDTDYDFSDYTLEELQKEEEEVHNILIDEFHLVRIELDAILYISTVAFLFPLIIICKYVFAEKTERRFFLTNADLLDILVFIMIVWIWETVTVYENTDIKEELFGPEEDSNPEVKFVDNVIYDIVNDIFHLDYLMAAVTAVLWIRSIVLLRLTETFGPMLVMIYRMFLIVLVFLFIYFLGILTFSCIAALTLTTNPNFSNLFEASKTYVSSSLGSFEFEQYDESDDWKSYYGLFLHLAVLFSNMILMINLLIAIMSDTYAQLSELRTGLFWGQVIKEMPKLAYDKHYGALAMFPFPLGWLSVMALPLLGFSKDKRWLR